MTIAAYAVRPGDVAYGRVCPECAGPKHRQSKRCAACYYDARRRGEYPPPPSARGQRPWNYIDGRSARRVTGGSKGRPQPQTHPWRGDNALLFVSRRVREMADRGIRPATAGGRARAHFAALTEDAA